MEIQKDINFRGVSKIYVKEKVTFNKSELGEYIEIFVELKEKGYIIAESYESDRWILPCKASNEYYNLTFEIDVFPDFKEALKCFCLIILRKGKSRSHVVMNAIKLNATILVSNGFKDVESFEMHLHKEIQKYVLARTVIAFLKYMNLPNSVKIEMICNEVCESERRNKELPPIKEVLLFDEVINDYFVLNENTFDLIYWPIRLWWEITTILPMRPSEFLRLKTNCVERDSNGIYWLTVIRSKKVKESVYDVDRVQKIQVNEHIYKLIQTFVNELLQVGISTEYLFSQEYYNLKSIYRKRRKKTVENRLHLDQFSSILKNFQTKIVKEKYEIEMTKPIVPSHTRHFAIINLFLQGFNLVSIAELAGHNDLNSPANYYNHAKNYVESYSYLLNKVNLTNNITRNFSDGFIGGRREKIDRGKIYSTSEAESLFLKVDYGYCKDTIDFPKNCGEDCRICPFFIFKPAINDTTEALHWLEEFSGKCSVDIGKVVESMISASKALYAHYKPDLNEDLKLKSRYLQQLMDHKLKVEQILMEDQLYD